MESKHTENEEGMRIVRRMRQEDARRMLPGTIVFLVLVVILSVALVIFDDVAEHWWRLLICVGLIGSAVMNYLNIRRQIKGKKPF